MQKALANAKIRKEKLLAKIGSTPSKPSPSKAAGPSTPAKPALEATPGNTGKRITGKRPQQATPLPATSPSIPTPGLKHGKQEDEQCVHKTGRQLFKDDDVPPEST